MSPVFRFAPSPNGYLHLGHALSACLNFDLAQRAGGRFLLRIEDIDRARCRPGYEAAIYQDLAWLGLSWEEPVRRQSQHFDDYRAALARLGAMGVLYPSFESRGEIARLVAERERAGPWPRDPDGAPLYPGHAKTLSAAERARRIAAGPYVLRLDMAAALACVAGSASPPFTSPLAAGGGSNFAAPNTPLSNSSPDTSLPSPPSQGGRKQERPAGRDQERPAEREQETPPCVNGLTWTETGRGPNGETGMIAAAPAAWGDVVLARKEMPTSYHLSVVVDDAAQGVTHVVRGHDLFAATSVHRLLQALLELPAPVYRHHRLILDADGRKLAKSTRATALRELRGQGASPADVRRLIGLGS